MIAGLDVADLPADVFDDASRCVYANIADPALIAVIDPDTQMIRALLPVPALAGSALLAFARIIKAGALMDDEIKATI